MKLSLEYKASLAEDKTAPLFFFVHGRAGTREVMWTFKRALPEGGSIIAPEAPRPDPLGGFSWWDVLAFDDITEEMIDEGVAKLSAFIDESILKFELKPRSIVALGFSQGSGALSLVLQRRPKLLNGLGILAGFVIKDWQPHPVEKLPPVFIAHGTEDKAVLLSRAEDGRKFLEERGAAVTFALDEVGHKVGSNGMRELKSWVQNLLQ